MKTLEKQLRKLTMNDLDSWAGKTIVGRGKEYVSRVQHLSRLEDGTLAAWVRGTFAYSTAVRIDEAGELEWSCTCPYPGGVCKHAVAVVLAAAKHVRLKQEIPMLEEDDELFSALLDLENGDDWSGYEDDPAVRHNLPEPPMSLQKELEAKSKAELVHLLLVLNGDNPELLRLLRQKEHLDQGRVEKIVRSLRGQITKKSREAAWSNSWNSEGHIPDYGPILKQLKVLLEEGYADAVVSLGEHLWESCQEQVEQSHDEGELITEIGECLDVVLEALPRSSLTPVQQTLWLFDRAVDDDFTMLGSPEDFLKKVVLSIDEWREVADKLEARYSRMASSKDYSSKYRREMVCGWLTIVLDYAAWPDRVVQLLEREASLSGRYDRLADALLRNGHPDKARLCCIDGFRKTAESSPDIAQELHARLHDMNVADGHLDMVAACTADLFFTRPSVRNYAQLHVEAEKIGCWDAVRSLVLIFLQTGARPGDLSIESPIPWPLPEPEIKWPVPLRRQLQDHFPNFRLLIEIAILEKRLDDAVRLNAERPRSASSDRGLDLTLAEAVAQSHPQTALDIWRREVEWLIAQVKPRAYEQAAEYLRMMRKVFQKTKRMNDWKALLVDLRKRHKAKRRLMQELDTLDKVLRLV